ncbi:MAG: hypothetical protein EZS28_003587 [Streblomastix strix]|uniref:Uncharacterized protein n=1 Tax=Streblomastix strix TaxID=222440 RepID=A0A5J4X0W1_9EUKA|nr:MAG: hypothetical protein EZS28_003587 [Streblomastix strix]
MNSSYGSDGMNTEKYHKVKIMNRKQTEIAIRSYAFMDEQKISENSYIVQMNPELCSYMNRIHFIEGDSDSAYQAISGNPIEDFTQYFNAVINDRDFYNDNDKYFFPTIKSDVYYEKKILALAIERQGPSMIALAPKNYIIFKNYCDDSKIKLKGVNQKTNKITKDYIVDCINEGKITKCTNMRLGQKNHQMSQFSIEKNRITERYFISSNSGRNIIASPQVTLVSQMFLLLRFNAIVSSAPQFENLHINVVLPLPTAPTIQ